MENLKQPKVEYSVAVEGIERLNAQLLMLDSAMGQLQETHNKTEKIIEDLMHFSENDPVIKDALSDGETAHSWQNIIQNYQKELLEYRQRLEKIEAKRKIYKDAINELISAEQWMQKQMEGETQGRA